MENSQTKTIRKIESKAVLNLQKKRVAAYARVSSGKDAMLHSLSAQVSYFSDLIQHREDWMYVGVYADEALTGTKDTRPEFQRLLADCRAGKIDMIITKHISRFARNTVTLLETTRNLKALGVDVYFEEQGLHTNSGQGEMVLTLLASCAQEESRSTSENCRWRIRDKFKQGIPIAVSMLGYRFKGSDLIIVPEEAEIVRSIYQDCLSGLGRNAIMKKMNAEGLKTKQGFAWSENSIEYILRNERYVGDLLLQKSYSPDYLTKKKHRNRGEMPRFYVRENHEPIIDRETFERVQRLLDQRAIHSCASASPTQTYPFTGKIICDQCGAHYRRKTTHGKISWNCGTFLRQGKAYCHAKQIPENTLKAVTAEVLGLDDFDEDVFNAQIKELHVPAFNHIIFVFYDGHTEERVWKDRSRSESWTDDMRRDMSDFMKDCHRERRTK